MSDIKFITPGNSSICLQFPYDQRLIYSPCLPFPLPFVALLTSAGKKPISPQSYFLHWEKEHENNQQKINNKLMEQKKNTSCLQLLRQSLCAMLVCRWHQVRKIFPFNTYPQPLDLLRDDSRMANGSKNVRAFFSGCVAWLTVGLSGRRNMLLILTFQKWIMLLARWNPSRNCHKVSRLVATVEPSAVR